MLSSIRERCLSSTDAHVCLTFSFIAIVDFCLEENVYGKMWASYSGISIIMDFARWIVGCVKFINREIFFLG